MSVIALLGDCTTTTALALASAWPVEDEVIVVEADRSGGSLAAWLDTPAIPSLSTIVANVHALDNAASTSWFTVDSMVRRAASGVRFIAAPVRSREANRAIGEANTTLFPMLANLNSPTFLADLGRHAAVDPVPVLVSTASTVIVCHRQVAASAAAASVRLERLAELVEALAPLGVPIMLAIIGDQPFDAGEIQQFVSREGEVEVSTQVLALDDLSAAVFAGRAGVSERRLNRLPLLRSARGLAAQLHGADPSLSDAETGAAAHDWLDHEVPL